MQELYLGRTLVTDPGLEALTRAPNLRVLNLSGCKFLSTKCLTHLTGALSLNLRVLNLARSEFLSPECLPHATGALSLNLRVLTVSGCKFLPRMSLLQLTGVFSLLDLSDPFSRSLVQDPSVDVGGGGRGGGGRSSPD